MKHWAWMGIVLLLVSPLAAQEEGRGLDFPDHEEFGAAPDGQRGDRQWDRAGNFNQNPTDQMEEVLSQAGVPLSDEQKKALETLQNEQREAMRQAFQQSGGAQRDGARGAPGERRGGAPPMRRQFEAFQEKLLATLTPAQQDVWKKFQNDQIRRRGGYAALRLALEEAGAPVTPEQEAQLQSLFQSYAEQQRELRRAAGQGVQPDPAQLRQLETQHLTQLAKLLNPAQRRALIEWRRNSPQQPR